MASSVTGDGLPEAAGSTSGAKEGPKTEDARGRSSTNGAPVKRSSLLKPKTAAAAAAGGGGGGGNGYDFSGSYEQTRRVRFKFGAHSLAVEATLAKLFENLTVECRHV